MSLDAQEFIFITASQMTGKGENVYLMSEMFSHCL